MITIKSSRPYFQTWIRRTGRQLAVSGKLTQTAVALSKLEGGNIDEWRGRLRELLEGHEPPSLDLLTRIDAILARPAKVKSVEHQQSPWF